ncbi:uncharacterized protein KNAG_0I01030 [Huiozyma naganishii CBS 8797]|uniref:Uncharacterized protein n=1 Tax=Huiozyma naganishii (strain ATCC MYA-139 / BCRC 22969 / CBS 8797 / KCTC 17520 / NBRC 10181 / NCYC 3082 / Yp74L-3) TaxID=1071383 RepID=J7S935_HUIN7|nr:hypothetical protein KNAG_0I01030 [Kazachstania naganishii CBS 8797]CCK71894.1 hypothetical protein KNAG_0I01030 [Kazachstania naganishii CBS 8797]
MDDPYKRSPNRVKRRLLSPRTGSQLGEPAKRRSPYESPQNRPHWSEKTSPLLSNRGGVQSQQISKKSSHHTSPLRPDSNKLETSLLGNTSPIRAKNILSKLREEVSKIDRLDSTNSPYKSALKSPRRRISPVRKSVKFEVKSEDSTSNALISTTRDRLSHDEQNKLSVSRNTNLSPIDEKPLASNDILQDILTTLNAMMMKQDKLLTRQNALEAKIDSLIIKKEKQDR